MQRLVSQKLPEQCFSLAAGRAQHRHRPLHVSWFQDLKGAQQLHSLPGLGLVKTDADSAAHCCRYEAINSFKGTTGIRGYRGPRPEKAAEAAS